MCKMNCFLKQSKYEGLFPSLMECKFLAFSLQKTIVWVQIRSWLHTEHELFIFVIFAISDMTCFVGSCGVTCQPEVPGMVTAKYLGKDLSWKETYTCWARDTSRVTWRIKHGKLWTFHFLSHQSYHCLSGKGSRLLFLYMWDKMQVVINFYSPLNLTASLQWSLQVLYCYLSFSREGVNNLVIFISYHHVTVDSIDMRIIDRQLWSAS